MLSTIIWCEWALGESQEEVKIMKQYHTRVDHLQNITHLNNVWNVNNVRMAHIIYLYTILYNVKKLLCSGLLFVGHYETIWDTCKLGRG